MAKQSDDRCVVDLDSGEVHRGGSCERLPPRPLRLLRVLAERQDQVVSRDELIQAVWGHLEAASEDSVNVAISTLRRVLGDQHRPPQIIQTIPRRGYRFCAADVELVQASPTQPAKSPPESKAEPEDLKARRAEQKSGPRFAWLLAGLAGLVVAGLGYWHFMPTQHTGSPTPVSLSPSASVPSVAVLPFLDLSPESDQGYFADALVDRIIHMLAQTQGLQVAARTSSFAFRDSQAQVEEIGVKLRVSAVLEGSILHDGEQMRVLAQLIDVQTGKHLWSRSYDRSTGELFELQDEIANEVAQTMTNTLLRSDVTRTPSNRAAYDLVVQAQRALDQGTVQSIQSAIARYQQALEIDSNYVSALVGWYEASELLQGLSGGNTAEQTRGAFGALQRAVDIAPEDPEVLRARAAEHRRLGQNEQAIDMYLRALEANPNDSRALGKLGDLYLFLGRYDEALQMLRLAERIDPLSAPIATRLADAYWSVGRAEEALAKLRENVRNSPQVPANYDRMATYLNQMGRTGEAMRYIIAPLELDPASTRRKFRVCEFYLQLADDAAAERCTDEFEQAAGPRFQLLYLRQIIHSFRGEWEQQNALMDELLVISNPNDPLTPALVAMSHARFDCVRALAVLQDRFPTVFDDPPSLSPIQSYAARTAIYCLQRGNQAESANQLLAEFRRTIERVRLQQGPWAVAGDEHAAAYALAGEDDKAVQALVDLVGSNWRYYWWGLEDRLDYTHLATRPDFIAMQQRLRAGVEREREYFEQHRDQPLF